MNNLFFNKKRKEKVVISFLFLFSFIFLIGFISAASPFKTTPTASGCEISPIIRDVLLQNQDFDFNFHVYNLSNGFPISNTSVSCYFHFYNQTGDHVFSQILKQDPCSEHEVCNEWAERMKGKNISTLGKYAYIVQCNGTASIGGCADKGQFEVTASGYSVYDKSLKTEDITKFMWFILALAIIFIVIGLWKLDPFMTMLGTIMLFTFGLYSAIYGIANVKTLYTNIFSLTIIGIAVVITARCMEEWLDNLNKL